MYCISLFKVARVEARVVWWVDNTCDNSLIKYKIKKFSLTLAATAINRAKSWVHRLPASRSSGRVRNTSFVSVTLVATAFGNQWRLTCASISAIIWAVFDSMNHNTKVAQWRGWRRTFWLDLRLKGCFFGNHHYSSIFIENLDAFPRIFCCPLLDNICWLSFKKSLFF